jgi:hypothetical protein
MSTIQPDKAWRNKAHRVIYALCQQSYLQANLLPNGTLRKRHVPYSVPDEAEQLVKCLQNNDEETAKSLFLHNYAISKLP